MRSQEKQRVEGSAFALSCRLGRTVTSGERRPESDVCVAFWCAADRCHRGEAELFSLQADQAEGQEEVCRQWVRGW